MIFPANLLHPQVFSWNENQKTKLAEVKTKEIAGYDTLRGGQTVQILAEKPPPANGCFNVEKGNTRLAHAQGYDDSEPVRNKQEVATFADTQRQTVRPNGQNVIPTKVARGRMNLQAQEMTYFNRGAQEQAFPEAAADTMKDYSKVTKPQGPTNKSNVNNKGPSGIRSNTQEGMAAGANSRSLSSKRAKLLHREGVAESSMKQKSEPGVTVLSRDKDAALPKLCGQGDTHDNTAHRSAMTRTGKLAQSLRNEIGHETRLTFGHVKTVAQFKPPQRQYLSDKSFPLSTFVPNVREATLRSKIELSEENNFSQNFVSNVALDKQTLRGYYKLKKMQPNKTQLSHAAAQVLSSEMLTNESGRLQNAYRELSKFLPAAEFVIPPEEVRLQNHSERQKSKEKTSTSRLMSAASSANGGDKPVSRYTRPTKKTPQEASFFPVTSIAA